MEEISITELESVRTEAIKADQCFSKGRLRDEFRMKPKPGAEPVAYYTNQFRRPYGVYRIADCEPMPAKSQKPPSQKQLRGRAISSIQAKLRSKLAQKSRRAAKWLDANPLFIDTETTGLDAAAEIIEIAICDSAGTVLFTSRLRPRSPIHPAAAAVHGITADTLIDAPTWPEISEQVRNTLVGRSVVIFNAEFDTRLLHQTAAAYGDPGRWIDALETHCAMSLAADVYGSTNRFSTISLTNAAAAAGVEWRGAAHGAVADALATVDLVRAIAGISRHLENKLAKMIGEG